MAAPTVVLTSDSGSSNSDLVTNNGALTIGNVEDGATVEYSTNGTDWSNNFTPLEGSNIVYVRQTDIAGNTSGSSTITFTLDTSVNAPTITIAGDANHDGVYNAAELGTDGTVTATIAIPSDAKAGDTLTYSVNGGTPVEVTLTDD